MTDTPQNIGVKAITPGTAREDIEKLEEELSRKLADCNDVMPKTLSEHQSKVFNSCLDVAYGLRKVPLHILEELQREVEKEDVRPIIGGIIGPKDYERGMRFGYEAGHTDATKWFKERISTYIERLRK